MKFGMRCVLYFFYIFILILKIWTYSSNCKLLYGLMYTILVTIVFPWYILFVRLPLDTRTSLICSSRVFARAQRPWCTRLSPKLVILYLELEGEFLATILPHSMRRYNCDNHYTTLLSRFVNSIGFIIMNFPYNFINDR